MANPTLSRQFGALPEHGAAGSVATDATLQGAKIPFAVGNDDPMTISGTVAKTAFLLALVVGSGMWGWSLVQPDGDRFRRSPRLVVPCSDRCRCPCDRHSVQPTTSRVYRSDLCADDGRRTRCDKSHLQRCV